MNLKFILIGFLLAFQTQLQASSIHQDLSGQLSHTNDYAFFDLDFDVESNATIWTDSFNPGFDPVLSFYDENGLLIAQNDDNVLFLGQEAWDSALELTNLIGDYTLAITRFAFFPGSDLDTAFIGRKGGRKLGGDAGIFHINVDSTIIESKPLATVPTGSTLSYLIIGMLMLWIFMTIMNTRQPIIRSLPA